MNSNLKCNTLQKSNLNNCLQYSNGVLYPNDLRGLWFAKQMQRIFWCNGNTCCSANYNIRRCRIRHRLIALLADNQLFPLHGTIVRGGVASSRRPKAAEGRPEWVSLLKMKSKKLPATRFQGSVSSSRLREPWNPCSTSGPRRHPPCTG